MAVSQFDLTGKVALVVGGSGGLGTAVSTGLAAAGADVIPVSRNRERNAEVAAAIEKLGHRSKAVSVDAADREQVEQFVDQVMDEFGHIDILVNMAGALVKIGRASCRERV